MQVVVAARKFGSAGEWRGAVIVDNEFHDAFRGRPLDAMIQEALEPVLLAASEDATDVTVKLDITLAKQAKAGQAG